MNDSTPVLSTPEASQETASPIAPGQEALLDEFIAEQEAAANAESGLILGKFKTPEDLAQAYSQLEKKLGQPAKADPQGSSTQDGYTAEQAAEVYGQGAVDQLAEKGIDLADVMWKADNGQDISNTYDDLAAAFNVPRQVVENYVAKASAPQTAGATDAELGEADAAELKAMVGGDEGFAALSQWAAKNLDQQELADYNSVVDSGNKDAIRWALKAMQFKATGQSSEPKLIGGGTVPTVDRFESQQQVLDAMNKLNSRGQRMYDVDDAYRAKVQNLLANSDVF